MKLTSKLTVWLIIVICSLSLTSCYEKDKLILDITKTSTVAPTQVRTPKVTPSLTPTNVIIATMLPSDQEAEFTKLMQTNNNCSGFCFWGIESGKTPFFTALDFFRQFHVIKNIDSSKEEQEYLDSFSFNDEKYYVSVDIIQKGETAEVKDIEIHGMGRTDTSSTYWTAYELTNFLKTNGKPEEFLIRMAEGPEGRFEYELILKYHDWVAEYYGNQSGIHPNLLVACPLGKYKIQSFRMKTLEKAYRRGTVEQSKLTGLSDDEFFKKLIEGSPNTCFNLDLGKFLEIINK
jgi:hypothetical protein